MEIPPDTLESVGVNELFVVVTVDVSYKTEQAVVGHIDEIHILIAVRAAPIVGYLSPSQFCDACALLRARKLDMEMTPDTLESVGVNKLFVVVTVDVSFTTEQEVVGHIDEIHILTVVRAVPIVGYLSPSQICDVCTLLHTRKVDMEMSPDTLEAVGINELFVAVGVDASFTTEQAASGSLGTHRAISLCSALQRWLEFFGQLFLSERTPQQ